MKDQPNILFLMTDQMQGGVLEPGHPCKTPNLDNLAESGFRFRKAYTPNAVCSPARASLMTGLLPHNHGVLHVLHCVDDDQSNLRVDHLHWGQRLQQTGYTTGYFGKWHVERTDHLEDFGWSINGVTSSELYKNKQKQIGGAAKESLMTYSVKSQGPLGYNSRVLYGVTDNPPEQRGVGVATELALEFLDAAMEGSQPWCCFVSITEPHDPFICGQEAYSQYDVDALELPLHIHDDLKGRPGLYRKARRSWEHFTDRQRREAMACYYASITEIDEQYGRIIRKVKEAGQLDNTITVFTSDHGELLGAHGLYTKNVMASEEVYQIPLIMAGPGIKKSVVSNARVGLHDLSPTLLDLTGCEPIITTDSHSFADVLQDPSLENKYSSGFAEYHGTRILLTQRIVWNDSWKYVFNGFDVDELYNLADDPYEMNNLIDNQEYDGILQKLSAQMWKAINETGDRSLLNMDNPSLRIPTYGPDI